jgi:hypothetical protein
MLGRMYLWTLIGHDTSQGEVLSGVSPDLAEVLRTAEPPLRDGRGFVCRVLEVVPRLSVFDLGAIHVPTGREWHGRLDSAGGIHWAARYRSADPELVYHLADPEPQDVIAGQSR